MPVGLEFFPGLIDSPLYNSKKRIVPFIRFMVLKTDGFNTKISFVKYSPNVLNSLTQAKVSSQYKRLWK